MAIFEQIVIGVISIALVICIILLVRKSRGDSVWRDKYEQTLDDHKQEIVNIMDQKDKEKSDEREKIEDRFHGILNTQTASHKKEKEDFNARLKKKDSRAYEAGENFFRGTINEILGVFELFNKYDHVALLSTPSKKPPLDAIGIDSEHLDFIEIKSSKSPLSKDERNVKKLIESGKVRYKVFEGNLPEMFKLAERKMRTSTPSVEERAFTNFIDAAGDSSKDVHTEFKMQNAGRTPLSDHK